MLQTGVFSLGIRTALAPLQRLSHVWGATAGLEQSVRGPPPSPVTRLIAQLATVAITVAGLIRQ